MTRQLTTAEVIYLGRAYETRRYWRELRGVIYALYGERARYVTQTVLTMDPKQGEAEDSSRLQGVQFIVTNAQQAVVPYDLTATWWQAHHLTPDERTLVTTTHLDDMLGDSLPLRLRSALRAYVEEHLGDLFLTVWEAQTPLVNTYDLGMPPTLPFSHVLVDDAGGQRELREDDAIQAGRDAARYAVWDRERRYVYNLYGPAAARMIKTTAWVYNDSDYDERPTFRVYDEAGQRIPYDLSLPFWSRFNFSSAAVAGYRERHRVGMPDVAPGISDDVEPEVSDEDRDALFTSSVLDALTVLQRDLLEIQFQAIRQYASPSTTEYDLTTPPPHFPALLVGD